MASVNAYAGTVPANYEEFLGPVLFEPYSIDLVDRTDTRAKRILELACGTGRVTRHLCNNTPADASIIATDLNDDMLAVAKKLIRNSKVTWEQADAQNLPFGDSGFDLVICQFGIMFLPDKQAGLSEAFRVLKPGGRFIFNVWDRVAENPRSADLEAVMKQVLGADAPDFLSKGPYSFFDVPVLESLLATTGFTDVRYEYVRKTTYYSSIDDYIHGFVDGTPLGAYLAQQPAEIRESITGGLTKLMREQFGNNPVPSPMQAIVFDVSK